MRLFFAIVPDQRTKSKIYPLIRKFKDHALGGNFTSIDNLHLTILFIGEVDEDGRDRLIRIFDTLNFDPFVIKTRQIGFFANRGSNEILVWHLEPSQELLSVYESVRMLSEHEGFSFESKHYRPHFTLARKVSFREGFLEKADLRTVPIIPMKCERLSLMESLRVEDRLVYREIYGKTMNETLK